MTGTRAIPRTLSRFLLTCLLRGMTVDSAALIPFAVFLLTCLLRGMTERTWDIRLRTKFLLTCLLRGMTYLLYDFLFFINISTHMPLARHDAPQTTRRLLLQISTHMPLARHDTIALTKLCERMISTHMPLARHDAGNWTTLNNAIAFLLTCLLRGMTERDEFTNYFANFYSHASCEA